MSLSSKYIYEDTNQKTKYNCEISLKENEIYLNVKEEDIFNKEYEASLPLSTLLEKNNMFKICNNNEDYYNLIVKLINAKKYKIIKEANDIFVVFYIKNIITEKEDEMKLCLRRKDLEINSILESYNNVIKDLKNENLKLKNNISILNNDVSELKNENLKLKNNISILNNDVSELKNENIFLKNEISELKKIILELKNNKEQMNQKLKELDIFYDLKYSTILNDNNERIFFQSLIKCNNMKLLYRLTRDGSEPKDFHRLCDNKGPTITLFKSDNNRKFGGYLSKNWESIGGWKTDNNVFLFSIDLNKKYKIKNNQKDTYYCDGIIGPDFCQLGFGNFGNLLAKNKCFEYNLISYYEVDQEYKEYEISGNYDILCKDLEVYKVEL